MIIGLNRHVSYFLVDVRLDVLALQLRCDLNAHELAIKMLSVFAHNSSLLYGSTRLFLFCLRS